MNFICRMIRDIGYKIKSLKITNLKEDLPAERPGTDTCTSGKLRSLRQSCRNQLVVARGWGRCGWSRHSVCQFHPWDVEPFHQSAQEQLRASRESDPCGSFRRSEADIELLWRGSQGWGWKSSCRWNPTVSIQFQLMIFILLYSGFYRWRMMDRWGWRSQMIKYKQLSVS